jgi:hypothetical protein
MPQAPLPFTSLSGATSPGPGAVKDLEGVFSRHTLHVVETGGGTSGAYVYLEGSHDGQNWFPLTEVAVVNADVKQVTVTGTEHLVRYARAKVLDIYFSGSPVITATIASGM